ncbi:MAG: class I SAM-dependent methyltransferase [Caulobacter sp.]|nr:class I SAM-dependent methyltransferase [Caulobacter sp.]
MPIYQEKWIKSALDAADSAVLANDNGKLVDALSIFPSDLFLLIYFDRPAAWPNLARWLPHFPPEEDQRLWAGNSGLYLMQQASVFIDDLFAAYGAYNPRTVRVLDYGCGWGRMLRLLYRRASIDNIYGADPWEPSFERCRQFNVHANFGKVDYIPTKLPFDGKFDIAYLFSVFTHISDESQKAVLKTLRPQMADDGLLAVTIRQANYWPKTAWPDEALRMKLMEQHLREGFAFIPHGVEPGSHQTTHYGDTSQTLDYINAEWTDWKVQSVNWRMIDECQWTVYLRPN